MDNLATKEVLKREGHPCSYLALKHELFAKANHLVEIEGLVSELNVKHLVSCKWNNLSALNNSERQVERAAQIQ